MRIINAIINEPIVIGKQGENNATSVIFDIADLIELYGIGTVELWHKRSGELDAYRCNITQNSNHVVWEIKSKDTANAGYGKCQLVYKINDDVAKSIIWTTVVGSSLVFGNDKPDVDPTPETYLPLSGGTMTGPLILDGAPVINLQAATKKYVDDGLKTKQDKLIIDNIPLENSTNPISSGAVYSSLSGKQNTLTFDNIPKVNSNNPVTSSGVYTAIQNATAGSKGIFWCDYGVTTYADIETALVQDMLPVVYKDGFIFVFRGSQTPLFGHTFTSETGGFGSVNVKFVYCSSSSAWSTTSWIHVFNQDDLDIALSGKQDILTFDNTPTANSDNPVKSGGVYDAIQNILVDNHSICWCTMYTTTYEEIMEALEDGKLPVVLYEGIDAGIAGVYASNAFNTITFTSFISTSSEQNILIIITVDGSSNWDINVIDINGSSSDYLEKSGGTMTGPLILNASDDYSFSEAIPKFYVNDIASKLDLSNVSADIVWDDILYHAPIDIQCVAYRTANHCWYAVQHTVPNGQVSDTNGLCKSKDGVTWSTVDVGIANWTPSQYMAYSEELVVICGDDGRLAVTTDGVTWYNPITSSQNIAVKVYAGTFKGNYYICVDDILYESINGGVTFSTVTLPTLPTGADYKCTGIGVINDRMGVFFYDPLKIKSTQLVCLRNNGIWQVYEFIDTIGGLNGELQVATNQNYFYYLYETDSGKEIASTTGVAYRHIQVDNTINTLISDGTRVLLFSDNSCWQVFNNALHLVIEHVNLPTDMVNNNIDIMACGAEGQFMFGSSSTSKVYKSATPSSYYNLLPWLNKFRNEIENEIENIIINYIRLHFGT